MGESYTQSPSVLQEPYRPASPFTQYSPQSPGYSLSQGSPVPNSTNILSQDEFNNLIKTVQLLRISQLRYIVQKYSIPASGNKTKLLGLVIQVFHNLRYDPVLVEIMQNISNLLAQQDAPFATPALSSGSLEPCEANSDYTPPFNPTIALDTETAVFGPLLGKPGRSMGKFHFPSPANSNGASTLVAFLFYNGNTQPISLQFELNGIPFEISKDDPLTSPIDITTVMSPAGVDNLFEVKSLNTAVPLMIQFFQYEYIGLKACISQICGSIDITQQTPMVKTNTCKHEQPFSFIAFMSDALATGKWVCPICGSDAQLQNLIVVDSVSNLAAAKEQPQLVSQVPIGRPQQGNSENSQRQVQFAQMPAIDAIQPDSIFAPQTTDFFAGAPVIDHFEWDAF